MNIRLQTTPLVLVSALIITSCTNEVLMPNKIDYTDNQEISCSYSIPVDSALAYLDEFLNDDIDPSSRSLRKRVVASVSPIKYIRTASRATGGNPENENLLYVANFEDGQGYAILAADTRNGTL